MWTEVRYPDADITSEKMMTALIRECDNDGAEGVRGKDVRIGRMSRLGIILP